MTARAGVGKPAYDWFLANVRLMPFTSDEVVTLAERELTRFWADYATERHRNRKLPNYSCPSRPRNMRRSSPAPMPRSANG